MTDNHNHALATYRDFVLYKMLTNPDFKLSDLSRVIYQNNSFSKNEYEGALKNGLLNDIEQRAAEEFDVDTLFEVYEAFKDFSALIQTGDLTREFFEEMFFDTSHITKH